MCMETDDTLVRYRSVCPLMVSVLYFYSFSFMFIHSFINVNCLRAIFPNIYDYMS